MTRQKPSNVGVSTFATRDGDLALQGLFKGDWQAERDAGELDGEARPAHKIKVGKLAEGVLEF